jgi:hypothetical protein
MAFQKVIECWLIKKTIAWKFNFKNYKSSHRDVYTKKLVHHKIKRKHENLDIYVIFQYLGGHYRSKKPWPNLLQEEKIPF